MSAEADRPGVQALLNAVYFAVAVTAALLVWLAQILWEE